MKKKKILIKLMLIKDYFADIFWILHKKKKKKTKK
jgi:hypothetical protein